MSTTTLHGADALEAVAGIAPVRIHQWQRFGFRAPGEMLGKGKGGRRVYHQSDIVALAAARDLKQMGIPLAAINALVEYCTVGGGLERLGEFPVVLLADGKVWPIPREGGTWDAEPTTALRINLHAYHARCSKKLERYAKQRAKAKNN